MFITSTCQCLLNPHVKISPLLKLDNSFFFVFILILKFKNDDIIKCLDGVHPPYYSSWKLFQLQRFMSFTTKMVQSGHWRGVDTWLRFSIGTSLSTCTCQLPLFLVASNIFQLSLSFSTKNYSWKGVGNVIGKRGFSTSGNWKIYYGSNNQITTNHGGWRSSC